MTDSCFKTFSRMCSILTIKTSTIKITNFNLKFKNCSRYRAIRMTPISKKLLTTFIIWCNRKMESWFLATQSRESLWSWNWFRRLTWISTIGNSKKGNLSFLWWKEIFLLRMMKIWHLYKRNSSSFSCRSWNRTISTQSNPFSKISKFKVILSIRNLKKWMLWWVKLTKRRMSSKMAFYLQ